MKCCRCQLAPRVHDEMQAASVSQFALFWKLLTFEWTKLNRWVASAASNVQDKLKGSTPQQGNFEHVTKCFGWKIKTAYAERGQFAAWLRCSFSSGSVAVKDPWVWVCELRTYVVLLLGEIVTPCARKALDGPPGNRDKNTICWLNRIYHDRIYAHL